MGIIRAIIGPLVLLGRALFGRLSLCASTGGIMGTVAGALTSIALLGHHGTPPTAGDLLTMGIVLALLNMLLLVILSLWLRYVVADLFLPVVLNALLTSIATVYVVSVLSVPALGAIVGLLIGIVIGTLLCLLCHCLGLNVEVVSRG